MVTVEEGTRAAGKPDALAGNAIWRPYAKSGLRFSYWEVADVARGNEPQDGQAGRLDALIRLWADEDDAGLQRETIEYLVRALDEDRHSDGKLVPTELKGKGW